jgi:hypothetical protein
MNVEQDVRHPHQRLREAMEQFVVEAAKAGETIAAMFAAGDWSALFPDPPEPEPMVIDSSLWTGRAS